MILLVEPRIIECGLEYLSNGKKTDKHWKWYQTEFSEIPFLLPYYKLFSN